MKIIKTYPKYLTKHVECFYSVYGSKIENINSAHRRVPEGTLDIEFNLDSSIMTCKNGVDYIKKPVVALAGLYLSTNFIKYDGEVNLVGVVFKSGSAHLFVNDNLSDYKECAEDATLIFGNEIYTLCEQLKHGKSESQKHSLIELFLMNFLKKRNFKNDTLKIHDVVQQIHKMEGNVEIASLYKDYFISERTFRRKFVEFVGMSPKQYSSIIRIKSFCKKYELSRVPFVDIIYGLGYTDQSHFNKEFQKIVGINPSVFFKQLNSIGKEFVHLV